MRSLMQFAEADLVELSFGSNDKDVLKAILIINAPLTRELAEKLQVPYLFRSNGDPVLGPEGIALGHRLVDNDLSLPAGSTPGIFATYRADLLTGIKIKWKDDLHLTVTFRAHVTGDSQAYELLAFRKQYLKSKFECAIRSLQEEFDFSGKTENEGTSVDMSGSGGKAEGEGPLFQQPECIYCDRDVPRNEDGLHMHEGALIECPRPIVATLYDSSNAGEKQEEGPAIASAASMGIRKERQRNRRRPSADEVDATTVSEMEEAPAFPVN